MNRRSVKRLPLSCKQQPVRPKHLPEFAHQIVAGLGMIFLASGICANSGGGFIIRAVTIDALACYGSG